MPKSNESLKQVNQPFHALANDPILRIHHLKTVFHNAGFSERWEAHLQIVKHRLKEKTIEESSKTIYLELIKFQQERFPKPPFKCNADPLTAEGFLEREKIIKKWNYYLFAKNAHKNQSIPPLEKMLTPRQLFLCAEQIKKLPLPTESTFLNWVNIGLTEIPEEINNFKHLKKLDFRVNDIFFIPKRCFQNFTNLESLYLSYNKLTALDKETFVSLENLKALYLMENQLTELHKEIFAGLKNLQELDLCNNQLTELHQEIFAGLKKCKHLYLD